MGVVSRRWVWLVGEGGIYGCGCKEVHIYRLKRKFEIAYMSCKEGLAFTKMEAVCELEEKHGVNTVIKEE